MLGHRLCGFTYISFPPPPPHTHPVQVHLLDPERPGQPQRLQTEGINFAGLWEQQLLLDVNK
jgi:hypothetical protein